MAYANHEGVRIYYRVVGDGPPLVLHHGFAQSLKRWFLCGYVQALREHYRLILIDPRGHGGSDKPHDSGMYSFPVLVADVVAVLDELKIDKAAFWGYSHGGRIAFGLAKHFPERVSALIIGGQEAYERRIPPEAKYDGNPAAFMAGLLQRIEIDFATLPAARQAELLENDFEALGAALQDEESMVDVLPTMRMPCLLYAGEKDHFYPHMVQNATLMPNARVVGFPGLTHGQMFWENRLAVEQVLRFLHSIGWHRTDRPLASEAGDASRSGLTAPGAGGNL
jgi:pimeloyl-ACP methyl ester carboxylesterase